MKNQTENFNGWGIFAGEALNGGKAHVKTVFHSFNRSYTIQLDTGLQTFQLKTVFFPKGITSPKRRSDKVAEKIKKAIKDKGAAGANPEHWNLIYEA